MQDKEYWGGTDMVYQCLIDNKRTRAFKRAISDVVKPGNVVVDLGSGSGILSLFALDAGARKVYAVEASIDLIKTLEMTIHTNNLSDKLILVRGDAATIKLPEKVDVVICEMIATGLLDEVQIPVMNNILKFSKTDVKIIPSSFLQFVELVSTDNIFYNHQLHVVQYDYGLRDETKRNQTTSLSNKILYSKIDFTVKNDLDISVEETFAILMDGNINGLRFTNESELFGNNVLGGTPAYCMPLIYPLENISVKKGDRFTLKMSYKMCTGLKTLKFMLQKYTD